MESFYSLPFTILEIPCLKLKRPSWFRKPSAMVVYAIVLVSYFMVCGVHELESHDAGSLRTHRRAGLICGSGCPLIGRLTSGREVPESGAIIPPLEKKKDQRDSLA